MSDVAGRIENRVQIPTDEVSAYVATIEEVFGKHTGDYAQIAKTYRTEERVEALRRSEDRKGREKSCRRIFRLGRRFHQLP